MILCMYCCRDVMRFCLLGVVFCFDLYCCYITEGEVYGSKFVDVMIVLLMYMADRDCRVVVIIDSMSVHEVMC